MNDMKTLVQSRTVWANFIGFFAILLSVFGFQLSDADANQIIDVILQLVAGVSFLFSTAFRVVATKRLRL